MTNLSTLLLAADLVSSNVNPVLAAKNRVLGGLREQLKAAEAMVQGTEYKIKRTVLVQNSVTGKKERSEIERPLKKWYWRDAEGKVRFAVKAGNTRIAFKPGMTNVIVGDDTELPKVITTLIKAVEAGELDKQIAQVVAEKKPRKKPEAKKK